ncbi:MAG: hypothetical protein K0Q73_3191, partial [Paenibacillus sp.]|nr:hypothetical protein [Paenibacillus sp.]
MTELGMTLLPRVDMMYDWGTKRMEAIKQGIHSLEKDMTNTD